MTMTCTVCRHEKREQMDKALIGGVPLRNIAKQYGTSATALLRHKSDHLPKALVQAKQAQEAANADILIAQVENLNRRTLAILHKAEKAGNLEVALKAIAEVRRNHELIGKLLGELGRAKTPPSKHLHLHQEMPEAVRHFVLAAGRLPSSEEHARLIGQVEQKERNGDAPPDLGG